MEWVFPKQGILFGMEVTATNFMRAEMSMAIFQFSSLHRWNFSAGAQNIFQVYNAFKSVDEDFSGLTIKDM